MTKDRVVASRRSATESRSLLERAALQLFRTNGYAATSTKEIERLSGIPEKLIFRHYGGKEELFVAAVTGAFGGFLDSFAAAHPLDDQLPTTRIDLTRMFVTDTLEFAENHRRPLLDLMALRASSATPATVSPLDNLFSNFEHLAAQVAQQHGWSTAGAGQGTRLSAGVVLSTVLLSDLLYSRQYPRPDRAVLVEDLTQFVVRGAHVPEDAAT